MPARHYHSTVLADQYLQDHRDVLREATGTEPLHYQWQFNTLKRTDQTNAVLVLTNVQTGTPGSYTVVITNVDGAVARLTVLVYPKILLTQAERFTTAASLRSIREIRVIRGRSFP